MKENGSKLCLNFLQTSVNTKHLVGFNSTDIMLRHNIEKFTLN